MTFWEVLGTVFGGAFSFLYSPFTVSIALLVGIVATVAWTGMRAEAGAPWEITVLRVLLAVLVVMLFISVQVYIAVNDIGPLVWDWGTAS